MRNEDRKRVFVSLQALLKEAFENRAEFVGLDTTKPNQVLYDFNAGFVKGNIRYRVDYDDYVVNLTTPGGEVITEASSFLRSALRNALDIFLKRMVEESACILRSIERI